MLHILCLILKIIGMILLAILGILILLLCVVFFVPANYLIQTKTEDGIDGLFFEAKTHWILHLFTTYYIYKDKQSDWQVRIGWKTFNHKDHRNYSEENEDVKVEDIQTSEDEANVEKQSQIDDENHIELETQNKQKHTWIEKIKCTIRKIYDKIKSILETRDKLTEFLTDEVHLEAFKIVKREIGILARHLRPRRIKGYVRFGFDDPYRTGQMLAGLSILYPFFGENVEIYPDFEQKILEGDLYIKGHIRMVYLVTMLWRLFFNRYIRKTYRDYKMLKSK